MPILNYSTKVAYAKSIGEIQSILVRHGAHKIVTDYKDGVPVAVTFCLTVNENLVAFSLPANYDGVLRAMEKARVERRYRTQEHAMCVSWRIVKDWVAAQMAIVEAQLAEMAEVFLPYAVTQNGTTLYKDKELWSGKGPLRLQQTNS